MKTNLFRILLLSFLIISCDAYHSRNCDAFYYEYNNWQKINDQDTISFISNSNEEISFQLVEKYLSEPVEQGRRGGTCCDNDPSFIICDMFGSFFYSSDDLGIDMSLYFNQFEMFEQPIEDQTITFEVAFKDQSDTTFTNLHNLQIEPDYNFMSPRHSVHDSIIINNETYFDVIQSEFDTSRNVVDDKIYFWKILASRGKGIVYLERKDGEKYFLKE